MLEDLLNDIDFDFNNIIKFLEDNKPKKFYRKYRGIHRKTKRRYMFTYNPIFDNFVLPNLCFSTRLLRRYLDVKDN